MYADTTDTFWYFDTIRRSTDIVNGFIQMRCVFSTIYETLNCWTRKEIPIMKIDDSSKMHNSLFLAFHHSWSSLHFRSCFFFEFGSHVFCVIFFFLQLLIISVIICTTLEHELAENWEHWTCSEICNMQYVFVSISHDDFIFICVREPK